MALVEVRPLRRSSVFYSDLSSNRIACEEMAYNKPVHVLFDVGCSIIFLKIAHPSHGEARENGHSVRLPRRMADFSNSFQWVVYSRGCGARDHGAIHELMYPLNLSNRTNKWPLL